MPDPTGLIFLAGGISFVALCWSVGRANDRDHRQELNR